ncbi:MAG: hypothetical protein KJZ98_08055 [Burkholderiaceae bacterium]|nr:hypothetical protein [Burkholderiaceae bacterium]MEB2350927.1 hypothetical protein [Burkholderiaceae bacterium]
MQTLLDDAEAGDDDAQALIDAWIADALASPPGPAPLVAVPRTGIVVGQIERFCAKR